MNQDDALEMFVRFNSGGKALRKSEITMSILEAYWPSAKTEFGKILKDSYANFDTDFLIRTALMLYGNVIKSNINKELYSILHNKLLSKYDIKNDEKEYAFAYFNYGVLAIIDKWVESNCEEDVSKTANLIIKMLGFYD